jgi:hypothetical protein
VAKTKGPTSGRATLRTGPWHGTQTTNDPFDDGQSDLLVDSQNTYNPDVTGLTAYLQRPGTRLAGMEVTEAAIPIRGQGGFTFVAQDGTPYNFVVVAGLLFRVDASLREGFIVTPAGISISPSITARVQFVQMATNLIVSDGVNPPWLMTDMTSTPVTGTYIDYDGLGTPWAAHHIVEWGGGLVAILKQVGGVARQSDLAWSEPGLPDIGWQQSGFSNFWTYQQTGSTPLLALAPTNTALYIGRESSIGAITGALGPNLQSTATHDFAGFNIGMCCPATVQQFGNTIYFTDFIGRPWSYVAGAPPVAIWKQVRSIVDSSNIAFPSVTALTSVSAIEPTLNLYLVGTWSPSPASQGQVQQLLAFDAATGTYISRWSFGAGDGITIDSLYTLQDSSGRITLTILGSAPTQHPVPGATSIFMRILNPLSSVPQDLATEDGVLLATEAGWILTTESIPDIWKDDGELPPVNVTTSRLGYADDVVWNVDQCMVTTLSQAPVEIAITTGTTASTVQAVPQPINSQDGTYRAIAGCDAFGRGPTVTVSALTGDEQASFERISLIAIASNATADDP